MMQLPHKLTNLREAFLRNADESPAEFTKFIMELISLIDPYRSHQHIYAINFDKGVIQSLHQSIKSIRDTDNRSRLLSKAVDATIACYEKALAQKQQIARAKQKTISTVESLGPQLIQCPHCRSKVYNLDQHNQVFHPSLRVLAKRSKKGRSQI